MKVKSKSSGSDLSLAQNIAVLKQFRNSIDNGFGLLNQKKHRGVGGVDALFEQVIPAILTPELLCGLKNQITCQIRQQEQQLEQQEERKKLAQLEAQNLIKESATFAALESLTDTCEVQTATLSEESEDEDQASL